MSATPAVLDREIDGLREALALWTAGVAAAEAIGLVGERVEELFRHLARDRGDPRPGPAPRR